MPEIILSDDTAIAEIEPDRPTTGVADFDILRPAVIAEGKRQGHLLAPGIHAQVLDPEVFFIAVDPTLTPRKYLRRQPCGVRVAHRIAHRDLGRTVNAHDFRHL